VPRVVCGADWESLDSKTERHKLPAPLDLSSAKSIFSNEDSLRPAGGLGL
jgi:hypothetical protein